jgi:hypothetical protein
LTNTYRKRWLNPKPFFFALLLVVLSTGNGALYETSLTTTVVASSASSVCSVTYPDGSVPPQENVNSPHGYANKNKTLWVAISEKGEMRVRQDEDGWLIAPKVAWSRGIRGRLTVTGGRLDKLAPAMKSVISDAYGDIGFQPVSLVFPSEGCWKITGKVGGEELTFINKVTKSDW